MQSVVDSAVREAMMRRHEYITVEHLLYSILQHDAGIAIVAECGGDVDDMLQELLQFLTPQEKDEVTKLILLDAPPWVPLPGPQTEAYESLADVTFYGGAAGGGKTDLAIGLRLSLADAERVKCEANVLEKNALVRREGEKKKEGKKKNVKI